MTRKIKIEIYSSDYDDNENIVNGGMNGKVFVTEYETAETNDAGSIRTYEAKSIDTALLHVPYDQISEIDLYYIKDRQQFFKKFTVNN